jgi:hypothetical protein
MTAPPTDREFRIPFLVSYAYLRDQPASKVSSILAYPRFETLIDSGAFTAFSLGTEIKLSDYLEFLGKYRHRLFGYMALDKLQDPTATERQLRQMLAEGFRPVPVHVFGDDEARMDELFGLSEWVALGGLRRPHRGAAPLEYLAQKMRWAAGRKVHWLGYVQQGPIRRFRPFSCDSSSWSSGYRFGRIDCYLGRGRWVGWNYTQAMEGKVWLDREVREALDWYGIDAGEFCDPRQWKKGPRKAEVRKADALVARIPARSWVRYVRDVYREFGTRLFLASVPADIPHLVDAVEFIAAKENAA